MLRLLCASLYSNYERATRTTTGTTTTTVLHLQEQYEPTAFPFYDGRILIETVFANL